ncbi:MAG: phosphoenolpyruvate carboxylase, partial [Xenococcaceae cyanobacterium]
MSSLLQFSASELSMLSSSHLLLRHRLKLIEQLWESGLCSECGPDLVNLLKQMRAISSPEGLATEMPEFSVAQLIEKLPLNDAIAAARAFALYFQLINIVEQHYEQREQQLLKLASDRAQVVLDRHKDGNEKEQTKNLIPGVGQLENSLLEQEHNDQKPGTFQWLFPYLQRINMPPRKIQNLLEQLEIKLVFTAHPTEIVRHTIRKKQRRIAQILQKIDRAEEAIQGIGLLSSWEMDEAIAQLMEEIRLWWRTDELHQFKPKVLDEVDYALHYFQEVLFDALPQLSVRLKQALQSTFPWMQGPTNKFCQFGSWVGGDRDGNPFVTPQVTWETACYQRGIVLEKYIQSIQGLSELLSLSLHWSNVLQNLLDSLEKDRLQMPEIYEQLAIRYRQEPYRLKLAYIKKRLENTRDRNKLLSTPEDRLTASKIIPENIYRNGEEFLVELKLIQDNLSQTGLSC